MKLIKNINEKSKNEFKNMMEIANENIVKYYDHFYHTIEFIEHICIITEYCEVIYNSHNFLAFKPFATDD